MTLGDILAILILSFLMCFGVFVYFDNKDNEDGYNDIKNEIIYILPKMLKEVNEISNSDKTTNKNTILKDLSKDYGYSLNKHFEITNKDDKTLEIKNNRIISVYDKREIYNIEEEFKKENKDFNISKECKENICSIVIYE